MKKNLIVLFISMIILFSFLSLNLIERSNSFPGYGGNAKCNMCHNQPALVKNIDISFAMSDFATQRSVFSQYAQWSTDYVPVIPTNNRTDYNLEFIRMAFLKNSTDVMIMAQVPDSTYNATSSATSDKFGIIFNIDVVNFTIGQFLTNYNATATNLDNVLSGQMAFTNGHADLWYVDMASTPVNGSGFAQDKFISSGIGSDGATHQDVHIGTYYGNYAHGHGYQFFFVRHLNTNDPNDAQFNQDGKGIYYAIAYWDHSAMTYHHSSFDQMIIVGNNPNFAISPTYTQTNTVTQVTTSTETVSSGRDHTVTTTVTQSGSPGTISATTSSFTVVFIMIGLIIAIPTFSKMRNRKD